MTIAFSSALYYPYIDIKNEHWLRNAALFWDEIRTIVPTSYQNPYASDFARQLNDEGVLHPVRVSSEMEEIEALTDTVLDFLTDPAAVGVMFASEKHPTDCIHLEKIPHTLRKLVDLHPEKLPQAIRQLLRDPQSHNEWCHASPEFASFYMTLLASQLAERLGIGLVTESNTADQLAIAVHKRKPIEEAAPYMGRRGYGADFNAYGPRRVLPQTVAPSLLIDLIVQSIELPRDLGAKDVIKFKNAHREELALFRREVNRLVTEIPNNLSVQAIRQAVNDQYEANVRPAMRSLRLSLQAQGWDAALNGFLKVSFFSAAPTSAAILAGVPGPVALLAGVGVSLTASAVLLANQRRRTQVDNPYSYLLSLERQW